MVADLVPTTLVPAVEIENQFVYESKDILLALEERFGATLLPENSEENAIARQWIEEAETKGFKEAGYKFLLRTTGRAGWKCGSARLNKV
jgi:glutathione S-transferase